MPEEQLHTTTEGHAVPQADLTPPPRNGGDLLVEAMRQAGVEVAFGVISIHNLPLVEAVDRDLRFVPVRHEAAAVNAADGYARATGRIGVALTSTGTGAGNAAGSMLEALTAQSRVLHVTGNVNHDLIGEDTGAYHEVPRQLDMLRAVSAHALRVEDAHHARTTLAHALDLLAAPPFGPVSVDWPIDLQYLADPDHQAVPADATPNPDRPNTQAAPAASDDETAQSADLNRAAELMRAARRPLIWAGGGARRVGLSLTLLVEQWGAGVLTGVNGRGAVPEDHHLVIGNFATDESLAELIADADCLLTIGSHLRPTETRDGELPLPATHIQIDLDPDALGRNHPVTVGLQAEAGVTVDALLERLGEATEHATDPDWGMRVEAAAAAARAALRADIGAYADICDTLRERLPRRTPLVRDVTIPGSSWGNRLLAVYDPTDNVHAAGGGIGQGLAMAIGAAVGRPDGPVLALVGDGGLAVHLGELAVLAGEQPDVIVLLFNDGGYGVLRNLQRAADRDARAVDLRTPDFGRLARAFDLPHVVVGDADAFDDALRKAVRRGGPMIIEVCVPDLSPAPDELVPPISVP